MHNGEMPRDVLRPKGEKDHCPGNAAESWQSFLFLQGDRCQGAFLIILITGISVWIGGREAYHIGASGVVYGLASFLFTSGIIRREPRLLAITLLVTFLYGSLVWGIFPDFFPEKNISYEGHFWGLVSGVVLAFYFRKEGTMKHKPIIPKTYPPDDRENWYSTFDVMKIFGWPGCVTSAA